MDDDSLQLDLSVLFEGLDQGREYTAMLRDMTKALRQLRSASSAAKEAQDQLQQASATVSSATGGASAPRASAPSTGGSPALATTQATRSRRIPAAPSGSAPASSVPPVPRTPRQPPMSKDMQALYSTRINLPGGAAPLLGKTLEAAVGPAATRGILAGMAPIARFLGPTAVAFMLAKDAVVGFYQAAKASAEATNRLTEARATAGGSVSDVARLGLVGGSAEAARSLQERITSDPMAMTAGARVGVRNQKTSLGGSLNLSAQYLTAIENTAKIADESQRQRLALTLGIEQEVAKYSLLSEETRKRLKDQAKATEAISDPRAQAQAAEFEAAQKQMGQAWSNVRVAFGNLFSDDVTGVLNEIADGANALAKWLHGLRGNNRRYRTPLGALTGGAMGDKGYDVPANTPANISRQSPMMANTLAVQANTEALSRLNGTIGGGQKTQQALPGPLRGQFLHQAMMTGQLRMGALG